MFQPTNAGPKLPVRLTRRASGEETGHAPAADRFVRFDHNSADYKEADAALEELAEAVRGSNELFANPEDRIAVANEVSALRTLINGASVRLEAMSRATNGVMKWLAREVSSAAVRAIATRAMDALLTLLHHVI